MTEKPTFPAESSSSSRSSSVIRPLQVPISPPAHSPVSLHAMSTRSSDALARRQSAIHQSEQQRFPQQQQQQQQQQNLLQQHHHQHYHHPTSPESPRASGRLPLESPPGDLPPIEGRLTRKRARSINVDEANRSRIAELSLRSPGLGLSPPNSASAVSASDSICICPTPPKVPRPRNAFILYRQHYQASVVAKHPGLANPEISKIIGDHWRKEPEHVKNSWKNLAEEEKVRHQRQYPQYKYQPRRGGKGGPATRPTSATGDGSDQGRCPKCGGRFIATPRTPSTPFALGLGLSTGGGGEGSMHMPTIATNPRMVELSSSQQHFHHRQSIDSDYHGNGGIVYGDGRRHSAYYPHSLPEGLRPIDDEYEGASMHGMPRHRGLQQEDSGMPTSPDVKRRRFGGLDRSPDQAYVSPMSAAPHHQGHQGHSGFPPQPPYPPQQYHQQHPTSRRDSAVGFRGGSYPSHPGGSYQVPAPLPQPRPIAGPGGTQSQPPVQPQQMAPPPRPGRLSTANGIAPVPSEPSGKAGQPGFDESLTLAPLQIPPNSPTQSAETSGGARTLSSGVLSGLGTGPLSSNHGPWDDSQTRGVESLLMSIPYLNRLSALRRIEPPLGPPGPGGPAVETRGPVIAIEGTHEGLLRDVRPVIERALRESRECEVRIWTDSSVERALTPPDDGGSASKNDQAEDAEMADAQDKTSRLFGSRHNSITRASDSTENSTAGTHSVNASTATGPQQAGSPRALVDYLQTILRWHTKSAEIVKHITTVPKNNGSFKLIPVALVPGGFGLTLSDKAATTIEITDVYSPLDHWQWMASMWRGIVGADLVVYVREVTAEEAVLNNRPVEYHQGGVMEVKVAGGKVDETTERRLAFEVMEWIMAGSFREGYTFSGEGK